MLNTITSERNKILVETCRGIVFIKCVVKMNRDGAIDQQKVCYRIRDMRYGIKSAKMSIEGLCDLQAGTDQQVQYTCVFKAISLDTGD